MDRFCSPPRIARRPRARRISSSPAAVVVAVNLLPANEGRPMFRRSCALTLGVALLALPAGCRHPAAKPGPGVSTSNPRPDAPCQLTGNMRPSDACYDAITGRPVPCPPPGSGVVIPGGGYPNPPTTIRPDELPYPTPSEMIPRPDVPFAPPMPAPGGEGASANPKTGGQPVKTVPNK